MQYFKSNIVSLINFFGMIKPLRGVASALFIVAVVVFGSCNKQDLTPAYIEITYDDVNNCLDLSTFNDEHETNFDDEELNALRQHTFTHVNVYVNNKNLGCWPLPCKVPVLNLPEDQTSKLVVLPCFRMTGMSNTVAGYPFFSVLQKNVMLRKGETYKVADDPLVYKYSEYVTIPYLEVFSNSSSFTALDTLRSTHTFTPTIRDGRMVGEIVLQSDSDFFDVSSIPVKVPVYNYYVYMEITYKTENNMDIGVRLSTAQNPNTVHQLGGVYATSDEWKTTYFDVSSVFDYHYTSSNNTEVSLILTGSGNEDGRTRFYIDNIKIICLPRA